MSDIKSIVPFVANEVVAVTGNITSFIAMAKANGIIQRSQLEMIKQQTSKVLADAKAYHCGDIAITNLEQLARTQEYIDSLERQGRLHGLSLTMAMNQLQDLNDILRRNLREFEAR